MRKRFLSTILAVCMMLAILPATAVAATECPFVRPPGSTRISQGAPRTYTVGEAFSKWAVAIDINNSNSQPVRYDDNLEYWVNGVQIKDGYRFQEVGQKYMVVKRGDKEAGYEFQVIPALNGRLKDCSILKAPAKTTYRQSADAFDPRDMVVRCVFTDGTTQDLTYKDLEFYAGTRNMGDYKSGHAIREGYRFTEAGEKDLIVRVVNKEMRIPFTVTSFFTKEVSRVEMIKEPASFDYRVGEGFRTDDYAVRCFYSDGSTEDFTGNTLNITANSVTMYDGYKFVSSGKKNLVIRIGDFSAKYVLTVTGK
ncbi:MAG: hypothetical protein PHV18_12345 [Lachnospiraceae bacterium]|nr:hypothetical protein [Lachnospiraceae bacterium]